MNIVNQKPARLSPVYIDPIGKTFDPMQTLKDICVTPLFTPINQNQPVSMSANGNKITEDDIHGTLQNCLGNTLDVTAEQTMKNIFGDTLITFNKNTNLIIHDLFMIQSGTAAKLPEPSSKVIYTPAGDVIPACKQFIAGQCDYDYFFACLGYYTRSQTLGFYFVNELAFNDFITWFGNQMQMVGSVIPQQTAQMSADFQKLTLKGLTESIILRNNDTENNDPNSFARLIVQMLMNYTSNISPAEFGVLPFNLGELLCPKTVVFMNLEKHARATAKEIADEWKIINNSIQTKPKMVSNNQLMKLTAQTRNLQKIAAAANAAANFSKTGGIGRSANIKFRKTAPNNIDLARIIRKVMSKMENVNRSMNIYRKVKNTFAKPNRRDPDDWNKMGKSTSINYKPDIHVYIDTSGSISETNYEDAIKALIAMAKKLNINIYFNSFSHYMSQTTKLRLQDKSRAQIYRQFQKVPKVSGGTDYEQIWHFINSSKVRLRELSIIITDFEWTAPNEYIKQPANLYYIPCSNKDWNTIKYYAEAFCKSMLHNDTDFRKHILF